MLNETKRGKGAKKFSSGLIPEASKAAIFGRFSGSFDQQTPSRAYSGIVFADFTSEEVEFTAAGTAFAFHEIPFPNIVAKLRLFTDMQ